MKKRNLILGSLLLSACAAPQSVEEKVNAVSEYVEDKENSERVKYSLYGIDAEPSHMAEIKIDGISYSFGKLPDDKNEVGFHIAIDNKIIYIDQPMDGKLDYIIHTIPGTVEEDCSSKQGEFEKLVDKVLSAYNSN